jgi:ATP-dependent helicase HrpA
LVPGLLEEKVRQLLKTLPQKYRHRLMPLDAYAAEFCGFEHDHGEPLLRALTRAVEEKLMMKLPLDAFRMGELRPHLFMNFRLLDEHGGTLALSRSLADLRAQHGTRVEQQFAAASTPSVGDEPESDGGGELTGLTSWSFGDLPELMEVLVSGRKVVGFPALVDEESSVALRVFDTPEKARVQHRGGLRRLFMLNVREQMKQLEKTLFGTPIFRDMAMRFIAQGGEQALRMQIVAVMLERSCLLDPLPQNATEFEQRLREAKPRIGLVGQEVLRLVDAIVSDHVALQKKLAGLSKSYPAVAGDIDRQCLSLLGKDFILQTPFERLQQFSRYFKAASMRLDKLRNDPVRDARLMAEWQALAKPWERERLARLKAGAADAFLEEFRWLLEELRVALFAQELRTPTPVSVKRLQKAWDARPH